MLIRIIRIIILEIYLAALLNLPDIFHAHSPLNILLVLKNILKDNYSIMLLDQDEKIGDGRRENRNDAACLSVIVSGGKPYILLRGVILLLDWHRIACMYQVCIF